MATITQLMEGKVPGSVKVRKEGVLWGAGAYFVPYFCSNSGTWFGLRQDGYQSDSDDAPTDGWELYTEPKPKRMVPTYLWAVRDLHGVHQTDYYYSTASDLRKSHPSMTWYLRLDSTMIEVEENV